MHAMCDVCCGQFRGWCRSFTKTELFLTILEGILLVIFIGLLAFVILHLLACAKQELPSNIVPPDNILLPGEDVTKTTEGDSGGTATGTHTTLAPGVKCTWTPSHKTTAVSRYYEQAVTKPTTSANIQVDQNKPLLTSAKIDEELLPYLTDGEEAEPDYKQFVLALVKIRPPQDITFGCILTIIDDSWAVTAASCVEAIEEVDSLDSFVMMEEYGDSTHGRTHGVADVRIHPWYQGSNHSYDLVALKSEDSLVAGAKRAVELAAPLDFFLATIGHKFTILGYGRYRTIDEGPRGRRLRAAPSYWVAARQCAAWGGGGAGALRHLGAPRAQPAAACGARALCAGVLRARGAACNYCAGTPLLLRRRLLGLMSDDAQCGVACEPARYVNLPLLRDWLLALPRDDFGA